MGFYFLVQRKGKVFRNAQIASCDCTTWKKLLINFLKWLLCPRNDSFLTMCMLVVTQKLSLFASEVPEKLAELSQC